MASDWELNGVISHLLLSPRAQPEKRASEPKVDQEMLTKAPSHTIEIFWGEHRPDEQMRSERRASSHHKCHTQCREDGQAGEMRLQDATTLVPLLGPAVLIQKQERRCGRPVNRSCPVADKREEAHGDDIEVADSIVRAG